MLFFGSLTFYAFFHIPYVFILLFSTIFDFYIGKTMYAAEGARRRLLLMASLLSNLGMLAFFKYASFALESFVSASNVVGFTYDPIVWDIVLPVGISYYTFQTLSYSIDIYRGNLKPEKSLLDFGFFVTFFPQLVAGPIVRAGEFLPQTKEPERATFDRRLFGWGLNLFIIGLFGKIVLADRIAAPIVDVVYADAQSVGFMMAWLGTIAFSGQILFDFAGYSMSAIGVAMCFGFALPDNFRFPYAAAGFSDFWRRWHISLSSWLRDYLYISLGGNRKGVVRTYINLVATMVLGGLWHGAAWTFVAWGLLHGLYLIGERLLQPVIQATARTLGILALPVGIFVTYVLVCYAWVFFRAETFADGFAIVRAMSIPDFDFSGFTFQHGLLLAVMASVFAFQFRFRDTNLEQAWLRFPTFVRVSYLAGALFLIFATRGEQRVFIYFQF